MVDKFGRNSLILAANVGNPSAVKLLLESGLHNPIPELNGQILNLNHQTIGGETALMKAAGIGQREICA